MVAAFLTATAVVVAARGCLVLVLRLQPPQITLGLITALPATLLALQSKAAARAAETRKHQAHFRQSAAQHSSVLEAAVVGAGTTQRHSTCLVPLEAHPAILLAALAARREVLLTA